MQMILKRRRSFVTFCQDFKEVAIFQIVLPSMDCHEAKRNGLGIKSNWASRNDGLRTRCFSTTLDFYVVIASSTQNS